MGDADGVVVVPRQRIKDVLVRALNTREIEEQILQAALNGLPLTEARSKFKYHTLQRAATSQLGA